MPNDLGLEPLIRHCDMIPCSKEEATSPLVDETTDQKERSSRHAVRRSGHPTRRRDDDDDDDTWEGDWFPRRLVSEFIAWLPPPSLRPSPPARFSLSSVVAW